MLKQIMSAGEMPDKLHFGCGTKIKEGWWNVDANIILHANAQRLQNTWISEGVLMSPHSLPNSQFNHVLSEMVFEHIHPDMIPNTLYCLYHSMKPISEIEIIVPNFVKLAEHLVEFEANGRGMVYLDMIRNINNELLDPTFEDEGFFHGHKSIWTQRLATRWLSNEGFTEIRFTEEGDNLFYLKISAMKPGGNEYGSPRTP